MGDSLLREYGSCRKCGSPLGLCRLKDVNGNRHVWTWCALCYKIYKTVPKASRPEGLNLDDLPEYVTARARGLLTTPPGEKKLDRTHGTVTSVKGSTLAVLRRIAS